MEKNAISFAKDIRPLFRRIDIEHMSPMKIFLDDHAFMSDRKNAKSVYEYLNGTQQPQMPPGGPYWSKEQLDLYAQWMDDGCQP